MCLIAMKEKLLNILKKLFKADFVNIKDFKNTLYCGVGFSTLYSPILYCWQIMVYGKMFIIRVPFINPQLLDFGSHSNYAPIRLYLINFISRQLTAKR